MYRMGIMSMLASDAGVDSGRCVRMALVHDIAGASASSLLLLLLLWCQSLLSCCTSSLPLPHPHPPPPPPFSYTNLKPPTNKYVLITGVRAL